VNIGSASGFDYAWSVKTDNQANVYYTGYFRETVDVDPGLGTFNIASNGGRDAFIVKLDQDANFLWGIGMGGSGNEYSRTLEVDRENGNVYIAASQYSTDLADWGTGDFLNEIQGTPGTDEVLVLASYDTDGNNLCAFGIQTRQPGFYSTGWHSHMAIENGELFMVSNFSSATTDYDPSSATFFPAFAGGQWDVAISKYQLDPFSIELGDDFGFCASETATIDATVTDGTYLWQDNSTNPTLVVDMAGTYSVEVRSAGCVASDEITLDVSSVDVTLIQNGDTLVSNDDMATYQWIDCSDNSEIAGATDQEFIPTATGTYAVVVNNNGCIDTSACVLVDITTSILVGLESELIVYPNPIQENGQLNIEFGRTYQEVQIQVFAADGKLAKAFMVDQADQYQADLSGLPAGIFLLEILLDGQRHLHRVVK
ncbi:MAG: T9SS type A sorting domain-containing protein, partial [Bacteroidota bacterium]